jgi:hypothetical protein
MSIGLRQILMAACVSFAASASRALAAASAVVVAGDPVAQEFAARGARLVDHLRSHPDDAQLLTAGELERLTAAVANTPVSSADERLTDPRGQTVATLAVASPSPAIRLQRSAWASGGSEQVRPYRALFRAYLQAAGLDDADDRASRLSLADAASALIDALPSAAYIGTGYWELALFGAMTFRASSRLDAGGHSASSYDSPAIDIGYELDWVFDAPGRFTIYAQNVEGPYGHGECSDVQCRFEAVGLDGTARETWTFAGDQLIRETTREHSLILRSFEVLERLD